MDLLQEFIVAKFNYWVYIILMMLGLWAMIAKNNLIKKLVGMSIFQTAIILFYVSIGVKQERAIPILPHHAEEAGEHHETSEFNPRDFPNPIPHVLMLTAIVVGVSTLGVALSIGQRIHRDYGSLEEDEILAAIETGEKHHG